MVVPHRPSGGSLSSRTNVKTKIGIDRPIEAQRRNNSTVRSRGRRRVYEMKLPISSDPKYSVLSQWSVGVLHPGTTPSHLGSGTGEGMFLPTVGILVVVPSDPLTSFDSYQTQDAQRNSLGRVGVGGFTRSFLRTWSPPKLSYESWTRTVRVTPISDLRHSVCGSFSTLLKFTDL